MIDRNTTSYNLRDKEKLRIIDYGGEKVLVSYKEMEKFPQGFLVEKNKSLKELREKKSIDIYLFSDNEKKAIEEYLRFK